MMKRVWKSLRALHADERGSEGLEKLLIILAIVLPLLGLLIFFRDEIKAWVTETWNEAVGEEQGEHGDFFGGPSDAQTFSQ